jgi:hypothetical protein
MGNEAAARPTYAAWAVVLVAALLALSAGAASVLLADEPASRDGGGAEAPTIPHPEQVIHVGEVPCPVVMDNGVPRSHKAPCRQERDAQDRNVARIYNADGVLIGGSAL